MRRQKQRKKRIPEVLWRLFRDSARTLGDTIVFLISSQTTWCRCPCHGQRRCIVCTDDALSCLLRPDDPPDYSKLLSQCFVVLTPNTPSFQHSLCLQSIKSQHLLVTGTIELIISERPKPPNVICTGYDKGSQTSPIVELLTCSAWNLLLERVGAGTIFYLLKYTSIFLPLTRRSHNQVAGPLVTELSPKFRKLLAKTECRNSSLIRSAPWKRKKCDGAATEKLPVHLSNAVDDLCDSVTCLGCNRRTLVSRDKSICKRKRSHTSLCQADTHNDGTPTVNKERSSNQGCQHCSNEATVKSKKRPRSFGWQRHRKQRLLNVCEATSQKPLTETYSNIDSLSGRFRSCIISRISPDHEKVPTQCCCFLLQAIQKHFGATQINRQSIFYNSESFLSDFPSEHILYSLKPNVLGANVLICRIFGLQDFNAPIGLCIHSRSCSIQSSCLYHSLLKLFKILIRKVRSCRHSKLLDKHCTAPSFDHENNEDNDFMLMGAESLRVQEPNPQLQKSHAFNMNRSHEDTLGANNVLAELNMSYCSQRQVASFLWAFCRSVIPKDLLGNPSNWRNLRRNISKFVRLRRFEKFSLKQCMHKVKASEFPLLSNKHSSCYERNHVDNFELGQFGQQNLWNLNGNLKTFKQEVLESWIFWLFSCLLVPLVQANFYVTESEWGKQNVYYYRKSVWEKLTNQAVTSLRSQGYSLLNAASFFKIMNNRSFGYSKLRLLPKESGVRALANLRAASKMSVELFSSKGFSSEVKGRSLFCQKWLKPYYKKSVNTVLRDLHAVLKGSVMEEPAMLGASVFDYNDVYRKFCPFVLGLKNITLNFPDVYVVVADVQKAFDSVDQDMLLSIIKDVILKDDYILKQYQELVCTKKSLSVYDRIILNDQRFCNYGNTTLATYALHGILVNQEWTKCAKSRELYYNLKEHVKCNVLHLNKCFYHQNVGIPQGSVLSSLLCSFYYGRLEKNVILPFLDKVREPASQSSLAKYDHRNASATLNGDDGKSISEYLLLRFTDDFLLISTSKKQATSFFDRLQRGFREYNCYMNEKKFSLSFSTKDIPSLSSSRAYVGDDGISFLKWSGLLINCCTLEVQADYTRLLANHLNSTLTVRWQGTPLDHLKSRLRAYMRPKCHPIFFDSNINSSAVVRLNVYQAFLVCAMKFHCYVCDLSNNCSFQAAAYCDAIERSLRYMHKLIKKRMSTLGRSSCIHPILQLEKAEVEWLGLNAYISVLKRKQSRHGQLLPLLRHKLSVHVETGKLSLSSPLRYATDDSHSSICWKIKY